MSRALLHRGLIVCGILILATLGCSLFTPDGDDQLPQMPENPLVPENPEPKTSGPCDNPLYPVIAGATWTYKSSGGEFGDVEFTDTVADVRPDGFTLNSQIGEVSRTQEWRCTPEGLLLLTVGGGPSAGLSMEGMQAEFFTTGSSGVTLPKQIASGDQWSYSLDIEGTVDIAGTTGEETGNVTYEMAALGMETVTVPAGTFEAMKIQSNSVFDLQVTYQGFTVPILFSSQGTLWYAPGVGWVRSEETSDFGGSPTTTTTELQSYNIP